MIEFGKDTHTLGGFYRGEVLDNVDSSKLGRIKLEVFDVFDGISSSDLPWAVPAMPLYAGAGSDYGYFCVPEVGSLVWCFFERGDVYQPVYFAEATDGVHGLPSERTTNYPSRKVWKTKNGIVIYIDDDSSNKEVKVLHPSGSYVVIDNTGNITINGKTVTIQGTTVHINP